MYQRKKYYKKNSNYVKRVLSDKKRYKKKKQSGWGNKVMDFVTDPLRSGYKVPIQKAISGITSLLNVERKFKDTHTVTGITKTGSWTVANNPPQGDANGERNGDSIKGTVLTVTGTLIWNSAGDNYQQVRLVFMKWNKETNSPSWADVFDRAAVSNNDIMAQKDDSKVSWSRILVDQTYTLCANNPAVKIKFNIPVPWHVSFSAGTTTINSGAVMFGYVGSQATTNYPAMDMLCRYRYIDN